MAQKISSELATYKIGEKTTIPLPKYNSFTGWPIFKDRKIIVVCKDYNEALKTLTELINKSKNK
jgi:hypothetical protein